MARFTPGSLRAAPVGGIRFDLARFEREFAACLAASPREAAGQPGSGIPLFDDGFDVARSSYFLSEFMSKFDDGKKNPAKEQVTWEKFHEAERLCFETNQRLSVQGFRGPFEQVISLAKNISDKILGRFDWDVASNGFGWGPGASTRLSRRHSDAAYKFSGNPETTIGNAILADAAIAAFPLWKESLDISKGDVGYCKIVPGNRIVTVPKNFKADRTIAIEPDMNMYIQKGIGALLRKRLKMAGCDLNDQTRNQRLAQIGSFAGTLATIDLSMASDTVSRVLVEKFIRPDWLAALEQTRSPFGVLPSGEKIFYQKFSSMGNGFTFELESLIFYSLALAWCHYHGEEVHRVSVYGDDIILPSTAAAGFCGLLRFCGFKTNDKKSYWTGPFRESCGKHFHNGHDISPFYIRRPVEHITDLFLVHNNIRRYALRHPDVRGPLEKLCWSIRQLAPAKWRKPRLPDGYGDGAFIGFFDEVTPKLHPDGWEYCVTQVFTSKTSHVNTEVPGLLVKSIFSLSRRPADRLLWGYIPSDDESPFESDPSRVNGYRVANCLVPLSAFEGLAA